MASKITDPKGERYRVGQVLDYKHGGQLEVIFVSPDREDRSPYQCCLPGGDKTKNGWFRHNQLSQRNVETT